MPDSEWLPRQSCLNPQIKNAMLMAIKGKKLLTVKFISVLTECLNDKSVKQKLEICYSSKQMFENPTINFNTLCNSLARIACCSSEFLHVSSW
jgi:hypothetical protein